MRDTGRDDLGSVRSEVRALTRRVVTDHLEEQAPERLEDFVKLFGSLYRSTVERGGASGAGSGRSMTQPGFDNLLPAAVSVTYELVRSVLESGARGDGTEVGLALDRIEKELMRESGNPLLVLQLRRYLDARREELEGVAEEARLLEADDRSPFRPRHFDPHSGPGSKTPAQDTPSETRPPGILAELEPTDEGREKPSTSPDTGPIESRSPALAMWVERLRKDGVLFLRYRLWLTDRELVTNVTDRHDSEEFERDPEIYFRQFYKKVENLCRESSAKTIRGRFHGLAGELAARVVPKPVLDKLREHVDLAPRLQIFSEEPWVPWELLALDTDEDREPAFLGERFAVTRSRPGKQGKHASELPMARFALVVPSESGLSYTRREEALIRSFEDRASEVHDIEPRVDSVRHAMHEGDFDVWHFAAHGSAPGDRSSDWRLHLDSREHLESADLHRVSFKTQPLVFLNACAVGRSERSLTGVAGLADKLIEEGAGAVIGPLWAVDDASAFSFARVLYQELWARTPLGEAARRARAKVREANPLDPTPLAYAVFGHPGATHPGPVDRRRHR